MSALISTCYETINLSRVFFGSPEKRKDGQGRVRTLGRHDTVIKRAPIEPRRGAGLQAAHPQRQFTQPGGEPVGGRIAGATPRVLFEADVHPTAQESADGEHHGGRFEDDTAHRHHPRHPPTLDPQVGGLLLEE